MPNNYVLLDRIELNNTAASVTFDNIPQSGYTDLKIVASARGDNASVYVSTYISFNGSTASFQDRELYGTGSATGSGSSTTSPGPGQTSIYINGASSTASTFSNCEIYIPNYRSASTYKSYSVDSVVENNATANLDDLLAGLWSNNSAITSITLTPSSGSFVANSTFSLYGLAQVGTTPAIAPKADGGNVIETDGTYWYHSFLTNGTFTPQVGLTCDYLVVAGGGGGGFNMGGAGGGGGLRSTVTATGGGGTLETATSLAKDTSYSVTIGAGGVGATTSIQPTNGNNSVFGSITSLGGGKGGSRQTSGVLNGSTGGSGGAPSTDGTINSSGAGTANQGFRSGLLISGHNWTPGGGGAGAVGQDASATTATAGGNGVATVISGTSTYYGGGGGGSSYWQTGTRLGGAGGLGGGGTGGGGSGSAIAATAGTINTGGGGGGGSWSTTTNGAAGGSGIVIIRYLVA